MNVVDDLKDLFLSWAYDMDDEKIPQEIVDVAFEIGKFQNYLIMFLFSFHTLSFTFFIYINHRYNS